MYVFVIRKRRRVKDTPARGVIPPNGRMDQFLIDPVRIMYQYIFDIRAHCTCSDCRNKRAYIY